MANETNVNSRSVFRSTGLKQAVDSVKQEIRELYLEDQIPWVIGYSGGKDSTAVLQLVWLAVAEIPVERRTKPIHVISTDTLVENPIVASWVNRSIETMSLAAAANQMPIRPHRLTPEINDTFWVNLIGRGYPAPRINFRWCTHRLKIKPSNKFIRDMVRENGEAILVLGTRRAESSLRARNMAEHAKKAIRDRLAPNASMQNSLVYTPIESWSNDEVWTFLVQVKNPWGYPNHDLMSMYRGASADGECPLVVDTSTPSCGNSRFGCYVCTLVDQDKSMAAMIQNDRDKEWMEPLLSLRDDLDFRGDEKRALERKRREFRRMTGKLTMKNGRLVPGPYTQDARAYWLRRVLEVQKAVEEMAPEEVQGWKLLTIEELQEIRSIWVIEKHEIEDLVPAIYQEVTGEPYPAPPVDDHLVFDADSLRLLHEQCGKDDMHFELVRNLLDIERRYRTMTARRGLFAELENAVERCFYDGEHDAFLRAQGATYASDTAPESGHDGEDDGGVLGDEPAAKKKAIQTSSTIIP